ncbi:MAG: sigma-54-dependent Fis family transcriptional regulator, partial [Planctomycetes bacterium]|nr:sigma-54-dependent Fis family transcriptional regulator [Planctomycetota bacterium]
MLVRLILCIDDESLLNRLQQAFKDADVQLACHDHPKSAWQKAIRSCADVVVISRSLIPKPDEVSIALLNELPERPTTVILQDAEDSEAQARLVAMGADTVLD